MQANITDFDGEINNNNTGSSIDPTTCEFKDIPSDIETVMFPGAYGQGMNFINFERFANLKSIIMGSHCFVDIRKIRFENLNLLESLKVGELCFTTSDDRDPSSFCMIINCPKLKKIDIGKGSFLAFQEFRLEKLPALQSLYLRSSNFVYGNNFNLIGRRGRIECSI